MSSLAMRQPNRLSGLFWTGLFADSTNFALHSFIEVTHG
jgi:hypothetical protein